MYLEEQQSNGNMEMHDPNPDALCAVGMKFCPVGMTTTISSSLPGAFV